ncbi:DNA phosphorothioation-dependent restriction protein DptH, partial [Neobacillus drentensis]
GYIELNYEEDELTFNNGMDLKKVEIKENDQIVAVSEDEKLVITPLPEAFNDDDELKINIMFDQVSVPFLLKNELPDAMPITGQRIWKLIRETGKDIQWIKENNRLVLENREFYFHSEYREYFEWENQWVEEGLRSANISSDQLVGEDLELGDDLREAYSRYLTYFKIQNSIPSLCTVTQDLKERSLDLLREYQKEIQSFKSGSPAGRKGRDLFKLGTILSD